MGPKRALLREHLCWAGHSEVVASADSASGQLGLWSSIPCSLLCKLGKLLKSPNLIFFVRREWNLLEE